MTGLGSVGIRLGGGILPKPIVSQDSTLAIIGGKVGIGTVAPFAQLDLYNSTADTLLYIRSTLGTAVSGVSLNNSSGSNAEIQSYGDGMSGTSFGYPNSSYLTVFRGYNTLAIGTHINNDFILGSNNLARIRIKNNGNVGIGTAAPTALLSVNGSANNTTGVWSIFSDQRLKTDVGPISDALKTVLNLNGVTFRWKDADLDKKQGKVMGFIAQDVEKVLPQWVTDTGPDGMKQLEPIGVNALLVEAIKEQQGEIEALKARLEAIESVLTINNN